MRHADITMGPKTAPPPLTRLRGTARAPARGTLPSGGPGAAASAQTICILAEESLSLGADYRRGVRLIRSEHERQLVRDRLTLVDELPPRLTVGKLAHLGSTHLLERLDDLIDYS